MVFIRTSQPITTPSPVQVDATEGRNEDNERLAKELKWGACPQIGGSTESRSDWVRYTGHPYADFDICSACFDTSIKHTSYAGFFKAGQTRTAGTTCDFRKFWVRQAWKWVLWRGLTDAFLLTAAADFTGEIPCPNADTTKFELNAPTQERAWFSLIDPANGTPMGHIFTVCSSCLRSLETIMPLLKGLFKPSGIPYGLGTCDIIFRRERSWAFVDKLMDHAADIEDFQKQDVRPIIDLLHFFSRIPDCQRHLSVRDAHYKASSVIGFTVCQSCFETAIKPGLENPECSTNPVVLQFHGQRPAVRGEFVCHLYSVRMRKMWRDAVERGNVEWLRERIAERASKKKEIDAVIASGWAQVEHHKQESARFHSQGRLQATIAQSLNTMTIGGPFIGGLTVNTGMPAAQNMWGLSNQSMSLARNALNDVKRAQDDWRINWE